MGENEVLETKAKIKTMGINQGVITANFVRIDPNIFARINFEGQIFQYEIIEIDKRYIWNPVQIVELDNSKWRVK